MPRRSTRFGRPCLLTASASPTSLVSSPNRSSRATWRCSCPDDYFFVVPVGLGDCNHQLGDYAAAEQRYLQAATYKYLNISN